jgi:hypothetical protein
MVVGERYAQDRRLPARRPGPHYQGQQIEAGLVYPDDGAPFGGRFFSRAGHRSCHQAAMAASSRCVARSTGRCTLWRVVRDAEGAPDHLGHLAAGPDLATKAVCFRSWREECRQLGAVTKLNDARDR